MQTVTFTGTVCVSGAVPNALFAAKTQRAESRSALPMLPLSSHYYLSATTDSGDTISDDALSVDEATGIFSFPLPTGKTWHIEVGLKMQMMQSSCATALQPA